MARPHCASEGPSEGPGRSSSQEDEPERPLDANDIQKTYDTVNLKMDFNNIEDLGIDLGLFVRDVFDVTYAAAGRVVTPSVTSTTLIYNEPPVFGAQLRMLVGKR